MEQSILLQYTYKQYQWRNLSLDKHQNYSVMEQSIMLQYTYMYFNIFY